MDTNEKTVRVEKKKIKRSTIHISEYLQKMKSENKSLAGGKYLLEGFKTWYRQKYKNQAKSEEDFKTIFKEFLTSK